MNLQIAHRMAKLSEAAYLDEGEAVQQLYFKMGYLGSKFFEVDGAQCYAVWNRSEYVLCFRGTEPTEIGDVLADLNAKPVQSQTDGWVHAGFKGELDKLWPQIKDHHVKHKDKRFYITGHSLGAAMATIACSRFENRVKVWELYTFGSPRAGTQSFIDEIKTPHYRIVNNNDIVTTVPPMIMFYRHHGDLTYINMYGNIRRMTWWQRLKDKIRGRLRALSKGQPFDGAFDHSMGLYVKKLGKNLEENK